MGQLLQTLLVVIVGLGIAVGGFITYQQIQIKNDASNISQGVVTWAGTIENLYANQGNYAGLTTQVLVNSNDMPNGFNYPGSGNTINGPAGTVWSVAPSNNNTTFDIIGQGFNTTLCTSVVPQIKNGLYQVNVCGTVIKPTDPQWTTSINTACANCGANGTIVWTFR